MIRINLLPTRQAKKKDIGLKQLTLLGLLVVIALMGNYFWNTSVQETLDGKRGQVSKLQADIAQLDRIIGEVEQIAKQKEALEKKLKVLDDLRKGRSGPVKMLDNLATLMPERVWIVSIEEKGGSMVIKGGAVTNEDLADLIRALKTSPYFSKTEPTLKSSTQVTDKVLGLRVNFELSLQINYAA